MESTAANTSVIVNAGAGSDTIEITLTTQDLANLLQGVIVNGQSGVDNVIVHDENNVVPAGPYTMTDTTVGRPFAGQVEYTMIERLALHAGMRTNIESKVTPLFGSHASEEGQLNHVSNALVRDWGPESRWCVVEIMQQWHSQISVTTKPLRDRRGNVATWARSNRVKVYQS